MQIRSMSLVTRDVAKDLGITMYEARPILRLYGHKVRKFYAIDRKKYEALKASGVIKGRKPND